MQRYNLDVGTVEALIRIKFNGPKDPRDFDAPRYARKFIVQGHSRADDESRRGKKRTREDVDVELAENVTPSDDALEENDGFQLDFDGETMGDLDGDVFDGDEIDVANYEDDYESVDDFVSCV